MEEMKHPKRSRIKKNLLTDWGALMEFSDYVKEKVLYLEPDDLSETRRADELTEEDKSENTAENTDSDEGKDKQK